MHTHVLPVLLLAAACCSVEENNQYTIPIVRIIGSNDTIGTGFLVSSTKQKNNKYKIKIITALHVITRTGRATLVEVFSGGKMICRTRKIKTLRTNTELDTAVLEIETENDYPVLKLSDKPPKIGQKILSFGCSAGVIPIFTEGLVCRPAVGFHRKYAWITSANVWGGTSGGPIVDKLTGEVVGITSAMIVAQYLSIHVPVSHVHIFIDASKINKWLTGG